MLKRLCSVLILGIATFQAIHLSAQTTSGLITGLITDPTGAVIADAQVSITNQATGQVRTTKTEANGAYTVPLLPPGVYNLSVVKDGFARQDRQNVSLEVNQSDTINAVLGVASNSQTVNVTSAAPMLNTTSATLSDVVDHQATVDLPLNGREFTQLTLLTPGAAPVEGGQQSSFTVALGAGGISPSVNGQRGIQNNFTMDGVQNNSPYASVWAIAPPPDAIQEFAVQSHITDAQFSVSSGANINVATRAGTNTFHGSLYEFIRNDALDANTFPATTRLPYRQNQYGVYLGGPILIPHIVDGRNNTWFSAYWEGFRSSLSQTVLSSTLTPAMEAGDFSGVLGAQVGTDTLGRPEYANEIYDPTTSRPDPGHPGQYLRDPFPGNKLTTLNPVSLAIVKRYYPAPNLNVADNVLPNYQYPGLTATASDIFGIRLDHQFNEKNTAFIRFNRSNQHVTRPEDFATYVNTLSNYAQQVALGYTHVFNPETILEFHFGYTYTNPYTTDEPAGPAFNDSINFSAAAPPHDGISLGPQLSLTNGYSGVSQFAIPLGPQEAVDYHADFTKVISNHTLGVGAMYYHLRTFDDGWGAGVNFTQNATAQDALPGPTGFGPASFLLGALDSYSPWLGNTGSDQTANWYGLYAQDLWHVTKRLAVTAGLRWDYVTPPNYHRIVSGLNVLNGQFIVTGAVPPYFSKATGPSGYFEPQYNGFEPRFGVTFQAANRTVLHGAFAVLDDHDNTLILETQENRLSWPDATIVNQTSLDLGIPTTYLNNLPAASTFLGPSLAPFSSDGANPNNKIPYAMEFNAGIQEQLANSVVMKLDYVGSLSRHQYSNPNANTALYPGPGPISLRQPYPSYGGPATFSWNVAPGSYHALQAELQKSLSNGLSFRAAYTWSKSMDWSSDSFPAAEFPNFYDLASEWGPSNYSLKNMFILSGVYAVPVGRGKNFLSTSNGIVQSIVGNWNVGMIVTLESGQPFSVLAGADVANVGGGAQRAERNYGLSAYASSQTYANWLNKAAFTVPTAYTFANERRNDLVGPTFRDVDFNAFKDFIITHEARVQFRAEFFNILNNTNYGLPDDSVQDAAFGQILTAAGNGREVQFAVKVIF
jgi:Carboxypeptidase regulatory-like domain